MIMTQIGQPIPLIPPIPPVESVNQAFASQSFEEQPSPLLDRFLDLISDEGEFAAWKDPLSELIREWGSKAIKETDKESLEAVEECKEELRQILRDPILLIPQTRPVFINQDVFLVNEEGKSYELDGVPYAMSKTVVYQEDTLQYYQKYIDYFGSRQRISYVSHELAREMIDLLELFLEDLPYQPLNGSVDPTSSEMDEFMVETELDSLNNAFIDHDSVLKRGEKTKEDRREEIKRELVREEHARIHEELFQADLARCKEELKNFHQHSSDLQSKQDAVVAQQINKIKCMQKNVEANKADLDASKGMLKKEKERKNALEARHIRENQACKQAAFDYALATDAAIKKDKNKVF